MVFAAAAQRIAFAADGIGVSIPNRGLWFLRRPKILQKILQKKFQSLIGVYGFCG